MRELNSFAALFLDTINATNMLTGILEMILI